MTGLKTRSFGGREHLFSKQGRCALLCLSTSLQNWIARSGYSLSRAQGMALPSLESLGPVSGPARAAPWICGSLELRTNPDMQTCSPTTAPQKGLRPFHVGNLGDNLSVNVC